MSIVESIVDTTGIYIKLSSGYEISYTKSHLRNAVLSSGSMKNAFLELKTSLRSKIKNVIDPDDLTIDFKVDGTPLLLEWSNR